MTPGRVHVLCESSLIWSCLHTCSQRSPPWDAAGESPPDGIPAQPGLSPQLPASAWPRPSHCTSLGSGPVDRSCVCLPVSRCLEYINMDFFFKVFFLQDVQNYLISKPDEECGLYLGQKRTRLQVSKGRAQWGWEGTLS